MNMALSIQEQKSYDFSCQRCGECCKRYFIVSTPRELQEQVKFRGMELREFLDTHCQLFLQIFPFEQAPQKESQEGQAEKPKVHKNLLPSRIAKLVEQATGTLAEYFIVLPMICFQRAKDGACTFYTQDGSGAGGCSIYSARPMECRLFPFISMEKDADYSKLYPFCHGLKFKDEKLNYTDISFVHFKQTADYFSQMMEKGFCELWKMWPGNGVLLYRDKKIGEITEQEFFQAIAPYK